MPNNAMHLSLNQITPRNRDAILRPGDGSVGWRKESNANRKVKVKLIRQEMFFCGRIILDYGNWRFPHSGAIGRFQGRRLGPLVDGAKRVDNFPDSGGVGILQDSVYPFGLPPPSPGSIMIDPNYNYQGPIEACPTI